MCTINFSSSLCFRKGKYHIICKSLSPGIINHQLSYQSETQKILKGKKFRLVFHFLTLEDYLLEKLPAKHILQMNKDHMFSRRLPSLTSMCFPLSKGTKILDAPSNFPGALCTCKRTFYPLNLPHSPNNLMLQMIAIVYATTQPQLVGCKICLTIKRR